MNFTLHHVNWTHQVSKWTLLFPCSTVKPKGVKARKAGFPETSWQKHIYMDWVLMWTELSRSWLLQKGTEEIHFIKYSHIFVVFIWLFLIIIFNCFLSYWLKKNNYFGVKIMWSRCVGVSSFPASLPPSAPPPPPPLQLQVSVVSSGVEVKGDEELEPQVEQPLKSSVSFFFFFFTSQRTDQWWR